MAHLYLPVEYKYYKSWHVKVMALLTKVRRGRGKGEEQDMIKELIPYLTQCGGREDCPQLTE